MAQWLRVSLFWFLGGYSKLVCGLAASLRLYEVLAFKVMALGAGLNDLTALLGNILKFYLNPPKVGHYVNTYKRPLFYILWGPGRTQAEG